MARGKYLSLEEARKAKKLDRFAKEHPTKGRNLMTRIVRLSQTEIEKETGIKDVLGYCRPSTENIAVNLSIRSEQGANQDHTVLRNRKLTWMV